MKNFISINPHYQEWLEERNRSTRTIQTYSQALELFLANNQLTTQGIRQFLKSHLNKYNPNTLKIFRQALSFYAKFLAIKIDWERISGIIPKLARKLFEVLTLADLKQLKLARIERSKSTYLRNNLIFDFLFYSGLRVSELVNIRHSDWDTKAECLKVHGKGNKVRFVFLPPQLIENFKSNNNDYLFTNLQQKPLQTLVIRQIISQRIKKAGITKNITPHSFRRSFATHLYHKEVKLTTIQHLLGHESITTTERYIQSDYQTLYQDYSKIFR